MLTLFLLSIFPIFSTAELEPKRAEIVKPDDFSVRRFQEVIDGALKNRPKNPQEEVIALRAQLVIAERRWAELHEKRGENTPEAEKRELSRSQFLRASQAEMDHYRTLITRLEEEILKEKRKERAKRK